jgi:hypothetical protein
MIKKTITYKDYNDTERTEDFYFHLTEAELVDMQMSESGGLGELIQRVTNARDDIVTYNIFKDLFYRAYGEKSPDGKRFIKTKEVKDAFMQTEAASIIFMSLMQNEEEAAAFVNGIIPQKLLEEAAKVKKGKKANIAVIPADN